MTDAKQDKPGQVDAPLVAALRDEVQFLRSQLQVRDEEIGAYTSCFYRKNNVQPVL